MTVPFSDHGNPYCPRQAVHGHSHQRHHKTRVGGCTEEVLRWFNYSHASIDPGCKNNQTRVPNHPALSLHPCFVSTSPTMEKSQKADGFYRLVTELPQCSLLAVCKCCAASEECCEQGYRLVCMKLSCSMLWHLKCIKQSHCVSGLTFDSLRKNLVWWAVTWEI